MWSFLFLFFWGSTNKSQVAHKWMDPLEAMWLGLSSYQEAESVKEIPPIPLLLLPVGGTQSQVLPESPLQETLHKPYT